MSLLDELKIILRVSSDIYNPEIEMLMTAALADMKRVGIKESLLDADSLDAQVKMAVACYCKANFGFDNTEHDSFDAIYRQKVIDLMNSSSESSSGDSEWRGLTA